MINDLAVASHDRPSNMSSTNENDAIIIISGNVESKETSHVSPCVEWIPFPVLTFSYRSYKGDDDNAANTSIVAVST